jgi:hypothetical protein
MIDPDLLRDQAIATALDDCGLSPSCNEDDVAEFILALEKLGYVVVRKPEAQEE